MEIIARVVGVSGKVYTSPVKQYGKLFCVNNTFVGEPDIILGAFVEVSFKTLTPIHVVINNNDDYDVLCVGQPKFTLAEAIAEAEAWAVAMSIPAVMIVGE